MDALDKPSNETSRAPVRPEVELLLCCARAHLTDLNTERLEGVLTGDIDWPYLLRLATHHGLMPLLHRGLQTGWGALLPETVLQQLHLHYESNVVRNLFLTTKLQEILDLLGAHGLPVIPFKGPALAVLAYGDLSLRQFSDLDVLVRGQDMPRITELLGSRGYVLHADFGCQSHFFNAQNCVNLDVHQRLLPLHLPDPFRFECLWAGLEPVSLAGSTVRTLAREDLTLILCAHWWRDCLRWPRLVQLCDVAGLVDRRHGLDWERTSAVAGRLGIQRMLWGSLSLAHDVLGAQLPDEAHQRMRANANLNSLNAEARERLLRAAEEPPQSCEGATAASIVRHHGFNLRLRERRRDKVAYCLFRVGWTLRLAAKPNDNDRAVVPLPSFLHSLYYIVRPFRLISQYRLRLWEIFINAWL